MSSAIRTTSAVAFWACAWLVVYAYALYPVLIQFLARTFGKRRVTAEIGEVAPFVSLLIIARDEDAVIRQRIANALAVQYPADRIEVVVVSDGSNDQTANVVRTFGDPRVRLVDLPQSGGKAAAINQAVPQLRGEIVVLSDANTEFEPTAVRSLARWFADPKVGVVCGRLVLVDPLTGRNADGVYWRWETKLKLCEAQLDALLGANGAIYAVRRSLYVPLPNGTIVDDLVVPLLARLRHGCSVLYDAQAVATETTAPDLGEEFRRRCRIGAGDFQSLSLLWRLLIPWHGFISLAFFSHKVLRWLCPFFLIGALAASAVLVDRPVYRLALIVQVLIYMLAVAALLAPRRIRLPKLITLVSMFVSMNAALLTGFWKWLLGSGQGRWEPTLRA